MTALLHTGLLLAAFWTAVLLYRGRQPLRFVAGLAAGAACAHLGWAALHWGEMSRHPGAILDLSLGYCVLFLPLGPLLFAPQAATWRALPLALAAARLGCLAAGCCHGTPAPWGTHPTPLYEIALLVALHSAVRATPDARAAAVFLAGFGLERLVVEPWRATPPLAEPLIAPAAIAALWCAAGTGLLLAPRARRARARREEGTACERPCFS